jgi:hypothetical protein
MALFPLLVRDEKKCQMKNEKVNNMPKKQSFTFSTCQ